MNLRDRLLKEAKNFTGSTELLVFDTAPGYPCFVGNDLKFLGSASRPGGRALADYEVLSFYAGVTDATSWGDGVKKAEEARLRFMTK